MKPLCIDLFCGYGGWARGFLDAGYRVIGFDNEPKCAGRYPGEFVLADVRNLDGRRFRGARVIVASPPCTEFSQMCSVREAKYGIKADPQKGMELVQAARRVISEADPPVWCLENVKGSVRWISSALGPVRAKHGAWQLWGNFPGWIAPLQHKGGNRDFEKTSRDQRIRALIPYPLARALAEACL